MKNAMGFLGCVAYFWTVAGTELCAATSINFDTDPVGSPPPAPWVITTNGNSSVAVTDAAATTGSRSLALFEQLGKTARAKLPATMSAPAGMKTVIRFDMNPDIVLRESYNYVSGGYVTINRNDGYRVGAFNFDVRDTNDSGGSQLPEPNELQIVFMKPDYSANEVVGYFTPGTWYHFVVTLDYEAWTSTLRVETMGGTLIAERAYANSYHIVPTYIQFEGADDDNTYVDSIVIETVSKAVPPPVINTMAFTNGVPTLSWFVEGQAPVKVQRRGDLATGTWVDVFSGSGSGSFTDPAPPPTRGFYQVIFP